MSKILAFFSQKEVYGLLLIIGSVILIYKFSQKVLDKVMLKNKSNLEKKRRKTIVELLKNVVKYALIVILVISILNLYGVNVTSLVASLGIASAVLALALQDTLKDIISGAVIIFDNYYMVGDYVTYNGFTGKVVQLGLKSTKIQNLDGETLVIANRNVSSIINLSQTLASREVQLPTAYEENPEEVEKIILEIVEEIKTWPTMNKEKTKYIGVVELADSAVVYAIRFYCHIDNVWQYKRDLQRLILLKYNEHNIKIPYNQIEVHNAK